MSTRTPGPPGTLKAWIDAGRRRERLGILGVDAALDRVAGERHVALLERQPLARRDPDLLLDDVDAGDELGDRVLDLDARVHLEEVEVALVVEQELERAGVGVLHRARGVDDRAAQLAAHLLGHRDRRRLLRAASGAGAGSSTRARRGARRAVMIAEDLELDVARALDVLLDVDVADAERRLRFALRRLERLAQLRRRRG